MKTAIFERTGITMVEMGDSRPTTATREPPSLVPTYRSRASRIASGLAASDTLTSGEVAEMCNVSPRMASKWVDVGLLKGHRLPLSKDRRIVVADLIVFIRAHGMPMPDVLANVVATAAAQAELLAAADAYVGLASPPASGSTADDAYRRLILALADLRTA